MCGIFGFYSLQRFTSTNSTHSFSHPAQSPWHHIYESADEGSFTGFNRRSFGIVVNILFPNPFMSQFGRPRLDDKNRLGSYLFYLKVE